MLKRLLLTVLIYPYLSFGASDIIKHHVFREQDDWPDSSKFMNVSLLKRELNKIPSHNRKKAINESLKLLCRSVHCPDRQTTKKMISCLALLKSLGAKTEERILNNMLFGICDCFTELDDMQHFESLYKVIDLLLQLGANPKHCMYEEWGQEEPFPIMVRIFDYLPNISAHKQKAIDQVIRLTKCLCKAGCDPNIGGSTGGYGYITPLMLASGSPQLVACLLAVGANPNDFVVEPCEVTTFEQKYGSVSKYNHKYSMAFTMVDSELQYANTSVERITVLKKVKTMLLDHGARPLPDCLKGEYT